MSTLDAFLQPHHVEERCSNPKCRKILGAKEPKYTIRFKGKEGKEAPPYCRECARAILPKPVLPKRKEEDENTSE